MIPSRSALSKRQVLANFEVIETSLYVLQKSDYVHWSRGTENKIGTQRVEETPEPEHIGHCYCCIIPDKVRKKTPVLQGGTCPLTMSAGCQAARLPTAVNVRANAAVVRAVVGGEGGATQMISLQPRM